MASLNDNVYTKFMAQIDMNEREKNFSLSSKEEDVRKIRVGRKIEAVKNLKCEKIAEEFLK